MRPQIKEALGIQISLIIWRNHGPKSSEKKRPNDFGVVRRPEKECSIG